MVVVTTGAMRMAVGDFLVGRVAKRLDGHLEVQGLASQGMIRIDGDRFVGDACDEKRNLTTLVIVRDNLHPSGEFCVRGEQVARDFLRLSNPGAVPLFRRHGRFHGLSLGHAFELLLEARDDVLSAMQIEERASALRLIDDFSVIVTQGVGERNYLVLGDLVGHDVGPTMTYWAPRASGAFYPKEYPMIELITDLPDRVLGLKASGEVTADDYKSVLVPAIEEKLSAQKKVRLLYVIGDEFEGYSGGAAWEDAKVGMKHLTSFERVAVVTDVDWIENMIKAFGFALPGEVRVFDDDDLEDARQWISEPPSEGQLAFELIEDKSVLILQPKGELEAADFERLSAEVDPYLEKAGELKGLMVVSEHFPGWDDFSALSSHLRFVKDHHDKIRRVAMVTNDKVVSALPRLASRFLVAEAKAFPMTGRDEALLWVSGS